MRRLKSKMTCTPHKDILYVQVECPECARRDKEISRLRRKLKQVTDWFYDMKMAYELFKRNKSHARKQ